MIKNINKHIVMYSESLCAISLYQEVRSKLPYDNKSSFSNMNKKNTTISSNIDSSVKVCRHEFIPYNLSILSLISLTITISNVFSKNFHYYSSDNRVSKSFLIKRYRRRKGVYYLIIETGSIDALFIMTLMISTSTDCASISISF